MAELDTAGMEWASDSISLSKCTADKLPQVLRLKSESSYGFGSDALIDLKKPFLLHSIKKDYTKVLARSLARGRDDASKTTGPVLVIPEDYTGWFSVVNDDAKPRALHCSIEEIAKTRSQYFLVESDVRAYRDDGRPRSRRTDDDDGEEKPEDDRLSNDASSSSPGDGVEAKLYAATVVESGTILKAVGIFADEKKDVRRPGDGDERSETESSAEKEADSKKMTIEEAKEENEKEADEETTTNDGPEEKETEKEKDGGGSFYLKCTNNKSEFLFLPYHRRGDFYPIARPGSQNPHKLHTLSNLLKQFPLPLTVRLVHGMTPSRHRTLRLVEQLTDDAYVACCFADDRRIMLELNPAAVSATFEALADCSAAVAACGDASAWCDEKSPLYLRQIKVGACFRGSAKPTSQAAAEKKKEDTDGHLFYSYVDVGDRCRGDYGHVPKTGGRTPSGRTFSGVRALLPINMNKVTRIFRHRAGKEKISQKESKEKISQKESKEKISQKESKEKISQKESKEKISQESKGKLSQKSSKEKLTEKKELATKSGAPPEKMPILEESSIADCGEPTTLPSSEL